MIFSKASKPLRGELQIPGDKSISHRAVMLGALSDGVTEVTNFLPGADCLSTIGCFRKMGIDIELTEKGSAGADVVIRGKGLHGLSAPDSVLDCGNSGTTTRLLAGILSGQAFSSVLTGDDSIRKRPMGRIITPLSSMGASIESIPGNGCAPLQIEGRPLHGIHYTSPVASAQVKSAILLAGLYADSPTSVTEPNLSRNHTELMLRYFGGNVSSSGNTAEVLPEPSLTGRAIAVPGDISSAAFFIAAASIVPGSEVLLKNVGINPTRSGILDVLRAMGGRVEYLNAAGTPDHTSAGSPVGTPGSDSDASHAGKCAAGPGEPAADLLIRSADLSGTVIEGSMIPRLIDEIPVIAVLASAAQGTTVIRNAEELKVKESNRLEIIVNSLRSMGADIEGTADGMIIRGGRLLRGAVIDSHLDHRIAMSFAVASLIADGETEILRADCTEISYPEFYRDLGQLLR